MIDVDVTIRRLSRRNFIAQSGRAALAIALCPNTAFAAPKIAFPPPRPMRVADVHTQLGRTRADYYSWLKYVPATGSRSIETIPKPIRDHLLAENDYATKILGLVRNHERAFYKKLLGRVASDETIPAMRRGEWSYSIVYNGNARPRFTRKHVVSGQEQLLLDETERAKGHSYYRTTGHQVSPSAKLFAWAEDVIGNDRHRLCVHDIDSGQTRVIVDTDGYGYGGLTFSPSSRWLFWVWRDARNRPTRVYRTPVTGGPSTLIYEETDPGMFMQIARTAADGFVAVTLSGPDTSEVRLVAAGDENAVPVVVRARRKGHRYTVEEWDGALIALIDDAEAFDGKIVRLDRTSFAQTGELVPHRPGTQIVQMMAFKSALVRLEQTDGTPGIVMRSIKGVERTVEFDGDAYALTMSPDQDHGNGVCRVVFEGPATPQRWIDIDLATSKQTIVATQDIRGFDPGLFDVRRLYALAPDGEMVPITLLTRKGAPQDGRAPLMLYGYGAYGVSSDAKFEVPPTVLVESGWNYAIAHVRGGSEKGRRWFLDGRRDKKRNSFTDFIACARHLCKAGYAQEGRIVSYGLSAGGLLVGASMNMAPNLWAGVIAKVPFVDMLNTMSDASHPLVPLFRPDWGDPLSNVHDYDNMASISPYENVASADYPPLLTTAGLKDDRVGYWEPAKLVAAVRSQSTGKAPAMILTNMTAGHQGSSGRTDELQEMARFYAFSQGCIDRRFR